MTRFLLSLVFSVSMLNTGVRPEDEPPSNTTSWKATNFDFSRDLHRPWSSSCVVVHTRNYDDHSDNNSREYSNHCTMDFKSLSRSSLSAGLPSAPMQFALLPGESRTPIKTGLRGNYEHETAAWFYCKLHFS